MKKYAGSFLAALVGGLVFLLVYKAFDTRDNGRSYQPSVSDTPSMQANYMPRMATIGPDFVIAAQKSVHAVVHVKNELRQRNKVYNDFFDMFNDFFNSPYNQHNAPVVATGSGVIISGDGYIVTNNHVVQEAVKLEVTLNDKRTYPARIIGTDPSTDLALIKVDGADLPYLSFGNSDDVKVGEWVLAVGNPFNLTSTVTAGIVSAKARNINILGSRSAIESFIQTDAVVNRGNSGGALVNTEGDLVGINAAIASNTGSYTGYSFAIPVNIVKKVIDDFIKFGEIQRAYLGISFQEIDSEFAKKKGLENLQGIYVSETVENGSADAAGIKSGDVIVRINNTEIKSKSELLETIGTHRPGDRIVVYVSRNGQLKEYDVVLKNIEGNTNIVKTDKIEVLGAVFEPVTDKEKATLNIEHGMKVVDVGTGKLRNAGVKAGYILLNIDGEPVRTLDDLKTILNSKHGGSLMEGIYPNGQKAYYGIGI